MTAGGKSTNNQKNRKRERRSDQAVLSKTVPQRGQKSPPVGRGSGGEKREGRQQVLTGDSKETQENFKGRRLRAKSRGETRGGRRTKTPERTSSRKISERHRIRIKRKSTGGTRGERK